MITPEKLRERQTEIFNAITFYGKEDVADRGLCIVCYKLGTGIKNGLTFCSPDHQEMIFPEFSEDLQ